MSGFPIIDLIAGMIFVYFLLSIICSSAVEMLMAAAKARAKLLAEWLCSIFDKPVEIGGKQMRLGQAIMDHCSVTALSGEGKSPSYIDAKNFTSALLEKLTFNPNEPNNIANDLNTFIDKIQQTTILSTELKRVLLTYAYEARDKYKAMSNKTTSDLEMFRAKIEDWYNSSMERLTGNLKTKYARPFTLLVATITALLLNADSINIAKYLYSNPEARAQVAAQAYKAADDSTKVFYKRLDEISNANDTNVAQLKSTIQKGLDNISDAKAALYENLPFGWNSTFFNTLFPPHKFWSGILVLLTKLTGLVVTVFAIMLGAPFWFDMLNKVSNLRSTGGKPGTDNSANTNTATAQPAPITVTVNSNKDEEAVG
jgi:hypothetical protein